MRILYRDVLGIFRIDRQREKIILRSSDISLQGCTGEFPLEDGTISLDW